MIKAIIFDWGRTLFDRDNGRLFSEAVPLLNDLFEKYTLAIVSLVTNEPVAERHDAMEKEGVAKYFAFIEFVASDKDAAYERMVKRLAFDPSEIAIVDDRTLRGIAWGNRNGCVTVWLRQGKFSDETPTKETGEPTHTISTLDDLRKILVNHLHPGGVNG